MAYKKRKKTTRFRGSHTHGRGFKKKARGSGHRGGVGMAGTGKRGDAKKTMILNLYGNDYFGKDRTLRRGQARKKDPVMPIDHIAQRIDFLLKTGEAKEVKGAYEVDYSGYKILGSTDSKVKLIIKAKSASASALEAVSKAGGQIIFPAEKEEKEEPVKAEKKEEKVQVKKVPAKK